MSQLQQTYMRNGQVKKISVDVFDVVKPSNTQGMDYLSDYVTVPHQIWIAANTLSDSIIASAMLYHVSSSLLLSTQSFKADRSMLLR